MNHDYDNLIEETIEKYSIINTETKGYTIDKPLREFANAIEARLAEKYGRLAAENDHKLVEVVKRQTLQETIDEISRLREAERQSEDYHLKNVHLGKGWDTGISTKSERVAADLVGYHYVTGVTFEDTILKLIELRDGTNSECFKGSDASVRKVRSGNLR